MTIVIEEYQIAFSIPKEIICIILITVLSAGNMLFDKNKRKCQ